MENKNLTAGLAVVAFLAMASTLGWASQDQPKVPSLAEEIGSALPEMEIIPVAESETDLPSADSSYHDLSNDLGPQVIWPNAPGTGRSLKDM